MIQTILFYCLALLSEYSLAFELSTPATHRYAQFNDEQWSLIKNAIFSHPDTTDLELENRLEALFPQIDLPEQSSLEAFFQQEESVIKKVNKTRYQYRSCPLCGKLVSKISVHLRYHKDEFNYPCDQCPRMFKEACNLSRHKKRHEQKRTLESENLSALTATVVENLKKFSSMTGQKKAKKPKTADEKDQKELDDHLSLELKAPEYTPTESVKPILATLSLDGKQVADSSMETLARSLEHMAQKKPGVEKVLRNHVRLELKIKKHTPTKSADSANNLLKPQTAMEKKKHVNYPDLALSNLKKFTCSICSKQYKRQAILEQHMAICKFPPEKIGSRTAQKFECTLCEKKYGRIGHLDKHLLSHYRDPKKPVVAHLEALVCAVCSKKFKYDRDYQDHMNSHTGQKPHVCTNCNKGFATRSNLKDHMHHYCSERA